MQDADGSPPSSRSFDRGGNERRRRGREAHQDELDHGRHGRGRPGRLVPPLGGRLGGDTLSGFSWGPGKVTLVTAILLGLYASQGLRKDDPNVRHHGWAIAAVVVSIILSAGRSQRCWTRSTNLTLGTGDVSPGTGLILSVARLASSRSTPSFLPAPQADAKERSSAATSATRAPGAAPPGERQASPARRSGTRIRPSRHRAPLLRRHPHGPTTWSTARTRGHRPGYPAVIEHDAASAYVASGGRGRGASGRPGPRCSRYIRSRPKSLAAGMCPT